MLVSLIGCRSDDARTIQTRRSSGFEASPFCQEHECKSDGEWALRDGGVNRAYRVRGDESILIELGSRGSDVFSAAIGLYGKQTLRGDFPDLATEFFASVIGNCPAIPTALQADLSRRVSGVMEASPRRCGEWEVRAGRVLADYIITADR
jgi:hypothetical protein